MAIKQTAGREALGEFAPKFAELNAADAKAKHQNEMGFPIGAPNDDFAKYFIGQSYLAPLSTQQVGIYNVTFEPGCRKLDYVA